MTPLIDWLTREGAELSSLTLACDPDRDRHVRAARDVAAGEIVLRVPRRLLITREVARTSDIGAEIAASGGPLRSQHNVMAAFLLQEERRPGSRFAPYLASLPAAFPTSPLFFSAADLALLRGSFTARLIEERKATLARDHRAVCKRAPSLAPLSQGTFLRARLAVVTRVFGITVGGEATSALVPMADMMNHREPPDVGWTYDDDTESFVMVAFRPMAAGQPVHDSYGRKCNSRFFVHYGFVLEDNPDNEAEIQVSVPRDDPRYAEKAILLRDQDGPVQTLQIAARIDHARARRALAFLRVACAGERDLERLAAAPLPDLARVPPLSAQNEAAALARLAAACREALDRFDTSAEGDDALLLDPALSRNARAAIVMRRGEKRVLARWIDLASAALPVLRLPGERFAQAVTARHGGAAEVDRYLSGVAAALRPP